MKINDSQQYYNPYKSVCKNCIHFDSIRVVCTAFKDLIPISILNGTMKHDNPLPNQTNDIVFEPIE